MKLCKDCKWYEYPNICTCPKCHVYAPVNGETFCAIARATEDQCGMRAAWWEPKPEKKHYSPPDIAIAAFIIAFFVAGAYGWVMLGAYLQKQGLFWP